ncbi:MAG: hypothetical protein HZB25_13880 [Candidatus Eisenbacteria bacterium]|nr:hypothetical protein [Candidatus Eisenbacteria bacterium]
MWLVAAAVAGAGLPGGAAAQAGFPVTFLDPSPRSRAMGGTGVAVPGADAFGPHLNPAHLSDAKGLTWARSRTRLVPRLADDVELRSDALTLGAADVGLSLGGRPFNSLGGTVLDYGAVPALGENGMDTTGLRRSYEEVRDFGLAFRVFSTARGLAGLAGWKLPPIHRYADLAIGWRWKRFHSTVPLVYPWPPPDSVQGTARDFGLRLRVSPVHDLAGEVRDGRESDGGRLRAIGGVAVDLYAGVSWTNSHGDTVLATRFAPEPGVVPTALRRTGYGLRVTTGLPAFLQADEFGESPGLARWLGPTFTFTVAGEVVSQRHRPAIMTFVGRPDPVYERSATGWGAELTALGVLALRAGHMDESASMGVTGGTWGFGLNLHYADAVAVRYDRASYPLPYFAEPGEAAGGARMRAHPWSWRVDVNPYGVLKVLLGE